MSRSADFFYTVLIAQLMHKSSNHLGTEGRRHCVWPLPKEMQKQEWSEKTHDL